MKNNNPLDNYPSNASKNFCQLKSRQNGEFCGVSEYKKNGFLNTEETKTIYSIDQ